ncbi:MAG: hypothetical protein V2A54_16345 [Bacteroidota bacterium]
MSAKNPYLKYNKEAKAQIEKYRKDGARRSRENKNEGKPEEAINKTFLFIKYTEPDNGNRPIPSGTVFWNSPDIELFDSGENVIANNQITAGQSYAVNVVVQNQGDMACNSCTVELYLCNPYIGFDMAHATLLGAKVTAVNAHASAMVRFDYNPTNAEAGHKCMFARAYSFASLDMPLNAAALDTVNDRHIGQQNLSIVEQLEEFSFFMAANFTKITTVELAMKTVKLNPDQFRQTAIKKMIPATVKMMNAPEIKRADITKLPVIKPGLKPKFSIGKFSVLNPAMKNKWEIKLQKDSQKFEFTVPNLGLKKKEAAVLQIEAIDVKTKKSLGGLTLIVKG